MATNGFVKEEVHKMRTWMSIYIVVLWWFFNILLNKVKDFQLSAHFRLLRTFK